LCNKTWKILNHKQKIEQFNIKGALVPFFIGYFLLNLHKTYFMENYTNPEQGETKQDVQDLLNASLIFARALGLIFQEGEGIVVDITGDIKLVDDSKKVIVFSHNDQIHIYKCEQDLEEGTAVSMNGDEEEIDPSEIEVNGAEVVTPTDEQ
jgi:hypothetical protein